MPTTLSRLQDNLRLGVNYVREIWRDDEIKDSVTGVHAADIDLDGDIEVLASSADGRVRALTRDGRVLWDQVIGDKTGVTAVAACAPTSERLLARVIASTRDGKIYVLDQGGKIIVPDPGKPEITHWFNVESSISQVRISNVQPLTIVFAADNCHAYGFDISNNQLLWDFPTGDQIRALFHCDIDGDGEVETLIGSDDQHLYLLSSTGHLLASYLMDQAIYSLFAADVDQDGTIEILAGTRTKKFYALTATKEESWSITKKWEQRITSRPLAISVADVNYDRQLAILIACDDQSLVILDKEGKIIWREELDKRFYSLNAFDLDLDGHVEVLAGTNNAQVQAFRIQLSKKGLNQKIRRDYTALGKPDVTTLLDLTGEQRNLLISILGENYRSVDKKLSLAAAQTLQQAGHTTAALLMLLKLGKQRFRLLWENNQIGYRRALCLANISGDTRRDVVVGSLNGGLSMFNYKGHVIWSETFPDNQIIDVQSGHISQEHTEDLAFSSSTGSFMLMKPEKTGGLSKMRLTTPLNCPEAIACFYMLAPTHLSASEVLVGTASGKAYLYTNDFQEPAHIFHLPTSVNRVYATERDESDNIRNPELLISTANNQLFAYTRGGNCPWMYEIRSQILALCAKDLDNDGRLEVLIGSEDRNIYLLDDTGHLRWRYVLYHSVLALDTADIDGDGKLEILAGCADGILYVFTSDGDLIWRYEASDRIQALRVADIDGDGNFEIAMVEESRLEVLQAVNQQKLTALLNTCWNDLFSNCNPLEILLPLTRDNDPYLRAASLLQLASLKPLPIMAFDTLDNACKDTFDDVRKVLPEALMYAFPADPARAREILDKISRDRSRTVRIEVLEHLEILAEHDWRSVIIYLERAIQSSERNTRRAGLRKISHLLKQYADLIKDARDTIGESLFVLLTSLQDDKSDWVKDEAGRVLADFLNLFEEECLPYFHRLLASQIKGQPLEFVAYNIASPTIQRIIVSLQALIFGFDFPTALERLTTTAQNLEKVYELPYATQMWLIFRELQEMARQSSTIETLATYDFRLTAEQFQAIPIPYPHTDAFLHIGEHLNTIIRPLRLYLRRTDPNERLNALNESINALGHFQRQVEREYVGIKPLPNTLPPLLPEFVVLKGLIAHWQELFGAQHDELHGHAELMYDLQPRVVHLEETVGVWLQIANQGRAPASNVKITLRSDESFTTTRQVFETEVISANQDLRAEFLIEPILDSITLSFEIIYDDSEHEVHTEVYQEHLDVIEWQREFTRIENPYATGTPGQDGSMCYGRDADLDYLKDNLTRTTAQTVLVLYGQRRSGKTTLLYQLANSSLLVDHVPVMIDLQGIYDFAIENFLFKVAYEIFLAMKRKGLPISRPARADFVAGPKPDPTFAFDCFLDDVKDALQQQSQKLILLLDEFEVLEDQVHNGTLKLEIFSYLRSLMQKRQYIHFLLSGTHHIEKLTHGYWSVFFNIALHYRLSGRITPEGAKALITEPVLDTVEYDQLAVTKIRQLTADQPYLIHLVCRFLVDHCNQKRKNYATINDVNLVIDQVIETGEIHFAWLLDQIEEPQRILLQAIAEGSKDGGRQLDLEDISAIYHQHRLRYQSDDVISSLNTLWAEDIIETTGGKQQEKLPGETRYALAIGLLRQWLRAKKSLSTFSGKKGEQAFASLTEQNDSLSIEDTQKQTDSISEEQDHDAHELDSLQLQS